MNSSTDIAIENKIEKKFAAINYALHEAIRKQEESKKTTAHYPWISEYTLQLIDKRNEERTLMNFEREQHFNKLIKWQAKIDRQEFLLKMLEDGNWDEVKKLRKGVHLKSGRLHNMNGEMVDKKDKAETRAEYFAKIQWQIKFPDCLPEMPPKLPVELPINLNPF